MEQPSPPFTPGPWRVCNHNEIVANDAHETYIADIYDENGDWRANAKLIAAAPELLERCRMGLHDARDALSGDWEPCEEGWLAIIKDLEAVIARAA